MLRNMLTLEQLQALTTVEAAALLLVRQDMADDSGDRSGENNDDSLFMAWIESDPANGPAWAQACATWEHARHGDRSASQ